LIGGRNWLRGCRRSAGYAGIAALLLAAALATGCGGGGSSATAAGVPTAKELMQCVTEGGGRKGGVTPTTPPGFPAPVEMTAITGPQNDDIAVYLSRRPVFSHRIAHGFREFDEFHAQVLLGGRALLLYSPSFFTSDERELMLGCIEG
jgi:hypothetical protein